MARSGTKIRVSRPLHCGIPVIGRSIHRRYSLRSSQLGAMPSQTTQPDLYEYKHNVRVMAVLQYMVKSPKTVSNSLSGKWQPLEK